MFSNAQASAMEFSCLPMDVIGRVAERIYMQNYLRLHHDARGHENTAFLCRMGSLLTSLELLNWLIQSSSRSTSLWANATNLKGACEEQGARLQEGQFYN